MFACVDIALIGNQESDCISTLWCNHSWDCISRAMAAVIVIYKTSKTES